MFGGLISHGIVKCRLKNSEEIVLPESIFTEIETIEECGSTHQVYVYPGNLLRVINGSTIQLQVVYKVKALSVRTCPEAEGNIVISYSELDIENATT